MNPSEVLRRITAALDRAGIAYMLTGSFASSMYGALRSTMDIDIVIAASRDQVEQLVQLLPETEYYVELESALRAYDHESMFNVIDLANNWKVDIIFRKSRAFSQEEFKRRHSMNVDAIPVFVASAEDIVLAKLEWSRLAESHRQIEDVAAILRLQWSRLDQDYLKRWIAELGVQREWEKAKSTAQIVEHRIDDGAL
jgi:Uncharacterised nucleotidyltransferase